MKLTGMSIHNHSDLLKAREMIELLLATFFWGSTFLVQRTASELINSFLFNGVRFSVAGILLLILCKLRNKHLNKIEMIGPILGGSIVSIAINLQQLGIENTTAGKAGVITSLYLLFVPFFLALKGHIPKSYEILSLILSLVGFYFLSGLEDLKFHTGDGLVLLSAILFALHVIIVGIYSKKVDPLSFSAYQFLTCGMLSMIATLFFDVNYFAEVEATWFEISYACIFSILGGYTLQVYGQKKTSTPVASFIMSLEGVIAFFLGWLILSEKHSEIQTMGAILITLSAIYVCYKQGIDERQKFEGNNT